MALPRKRKRPLKKTAEIIERSPDAIIYAMDEASVKREATITHGWYPKGKTTVVLSPATKEKVSIVGAVKIGSGNLVHQKVDCFRKEQMIDFLDLLLEVEKDSEGPIYVILDNASPHKAIAVQEYLATVGARFIMLWLPPYSPELNPSENIWRQLRKEKTHNTLFENLEKLLGDVDSFFDSYRGPNETMKLLCALI